MSIEDQSSHTGRTGEPDHFLRRSLMVVGIVALVIFIALVLWYTINVLLLIFAGILLAIFLRGLSGLVSTYARIPGGWALFIVIVALFSLFSLFGWLFAPEIAAQFEELRETVPQAVQQLQTMLAGHEWGQRFLDATPGLNDLMPNGTAALAQIAGIFSTTLGIIVSTFIIVSVGIYLAAEPGVYSNGIIRLVPVRRRARAYEVLHALGDTLWRWLLGRLVSMAFVGVTIALGLALLGMPLALALGLLAALLDFIPNIGPWLAAAPAVLLALTISPTMALYVSIFYFVIQQIESYVVTPLVQREVVKLPPALNISAQVLLGVLVGLIGVAFASPLAAATLVLVRMLYIEGVLGDFSNQKASRDKQRQAGD